MSVCVFRGELAEDSADPLGVQRQSEETHPAQTLQVASDWTAVCHLSMPLYVHASTSVPFRVDYLSQKLISARDADRQQLREQIDGLERDIEELRCVWTDGTFWSLKYASTQREAGESGS